VKRTCIDPFDDPLQYLSRRWGRWPPTGGPSYAARMIQAAEDYVHRREMLSRTVEAFLKLRASSQRSSGQRVRLRVGRPEGGRAIEGAFALAILRWGNRNLPEEVQPGEVMALAVLVGVQPAPPRLDDVGLARGRRDQRQACKERWRVLVREARRLASTRPTPAIDPKDIEWAMDAVPDLPPSKRPKSRRPT
jgi:hypothetical protein